MPMIRAYSADAVRAAEAPLLDAGVPLMREAARAVAGTVIDELKSRGARVSGAVVLALVGGGNNGGDALFAAADLARRGVQVMAAVCATSVHEAGLSAARAAGVRTFHVSGATTDWPALRTAAERSDVWIDGLAGIGLRGPLREPLAGIVAALAELRATSPGEPIVIAVDTPSGVGDDGEIHSTLLPADVTVTMGAAKPGLLFPPAASLAGRLRIIELGLPLASAEPVALRLGQADVADLYPWPRWEDHKYTRGVVGVWAGSAVYPGAALLAVAGAMGTGPGMVRYLGAVQDMPRSYPEVVTVPGRIQAAVVGSGIEPGHGCAALGEALDHQVPTVVDAGAMADLTVVLRARGTPRTGGRAPLVITPHVGELAALLGVNREAVEARPVASAREAALRLGVTVVLKGSATVVVPAAGAVFAQHGGTAWLATAGAGDVLAGIIGTLFALAQTRAAEENRNLTTAETAHLAAAAVWLHAEAGNRAAAAAGGTDGGPIRASDIAAALPGVIAGLRSVVEE